MFSGSTNICIVTPQQTVYNRAIAGTDTNPGFPDILSRILVSQAEHESANFTSPVYLASNNAFGYKYTGSKYQVGQYNGYAAYPDLDSSAAELVDYIYRRVRDGSFPADLSTITTPDQYATLLKNASIGPYFEDSLSNYSAGLTSWFSQNVIEPVKKNPLIALAGFGFLALVAYSLTRSK